MTTQTWDFLDVSHDAVGILSLQAASSCPPHPCSQVTKGRSHFPLCMVVFLPVMGDSRAPITDHVHSISQTRNDKYILCSIEDLTRHSAPLKPEFWNQRFFFLTQAAHSVSLGCTRSKRFNFPLFLLLPPWDFSNILNSIKCLEWKPPLKANCCVPNKWLVSKALSPSELHLVALLLNAYSNIKRWLPSYAPKQSAGTDICSFSLSVAAKYSRRLLLCTIGWWLRMSSVHCLRAQKGRDGGLRKWLSSTAFLPVWGQSYYHPGLVCFCACRYLCLSHLCLEQTPWHWLLEFSLFYTLKQSCL